MSDKCLSRSELWNQWAAESAELRLMEERPGYDPSAHTAQRNIIETLARFTRSDCECQDGDAHD